jgi:hypothetical protein
MGWMKPVPRYQIWKYSRRSRSAVSERQHLSRYKSSPNAGLDLDRGHELWIRRV